MRFFHQCCKSSVHLFLEHINFHSWIWLPQREAQLKKNNPPKHAFRVLKPLGHCVLGPSCFRPLGFWIISPKSSMSLSLKSYCHGVYGHGILSLQVVVLYHLGLEVIICRLEKRPTTACKPSIVATYNLQHLQTLCNWCLLLATMLPFLHTSNIMSTSLLMFSNNNYCPTTKCTFYSKTRTKSK